jgi:hypothetical protein
MEAKVGLGEVENAQAVALLEQLLGQSSAETPGSACDQDIGHNIFLP